MSKVTIEDISRHTGLSRGTVSRALNDRPDISHQTKQKVLEACRQLNYVPSHAARSLATGRSYAVAVLVDDLRAVYSACFLRGVIVRAQEQGYAVYVSELASDPQNAAAHISALARERVDGVLLGTTLPTELIQPLTESLDKRPLVSTAPVPGIACDVLAPDYRESGRIIGRLALRRDRAQVLYVHQGNVPGAEDRREGFADACRERGIDPNPLIHTLPTTNSPTTEPLDPIRPRLAETTVLAATDDFLAFELALACQRAGRIPGQDVAIIGQGNELVGAKVSPTLTTVDFCGEEIGRRTLELALQRATHTRQDAPQSVAVAPVLIERESTRSL